MPRSSSRRSAVRHWRPDRALLPAQRHQYGHAELALTFGLRCDPGVGAEIWGRWPSVSRTEGVEFPLSGSSDAHPAIAIILPSHGDLRRPHRSVANKGRTACARRSRYREWSAARNKVPRCSDRGSASALPGRLAGVIAADRRKVAEHGGNVRRAFCSYGRRVGLGIAAGP